MKLADSVDGTSATRLLWLIAVFVAFAGYAVVILPREREITGVEQHARTLYDEANSNETKVRRSAELLRVKQRVEADLRQLVALRSPAAVTARAVRLFDEEGKRFAVDVRTVTPDTSPSGTVPDAPALNGTNWNVALRGRFRDIVGLLSDLPRHDILLELGDVELSATSAESPSPALDATLHATVYGLRSYSLSEDKHVQSPAR